MTLLTILCTAGTATAAGASFTFSDFTMRGLRSLAPSQGAAAMQAINKAAPSPLFMLLIFGTGAACLALCVLSALHLDAPGAMMRLIAGALYVVGVVLTTIGYHVPRNNRLEQLDAMSIEGEEYWATYLREWIPMNHVRTIAPLVSSVMLMFSMAPG